MPFIAFLVCQQFKYPKQCDQMALIVYILGQFTTIKNCPIVYKTYQSQ